MEPFSIGKVYLNEISEKVIDINPLSGKYCTFDCIFCPLGPTKVKTDIARDFDEIGAFLSDLDKVLKTEPVDLVFINPDGELLSLSRISEVIDLIKKHNIKVKIISNGYLFNRSEYQTILNNCDEIIGEVVVTNEEDFQKIQRPLKGYTLEEHVANMASFNLQYKGKFILDITILKNYSDKPQDIQSFEEFIHQIRPDEIHVHTPNKGKFKSAFGIDEVTLQRINDQLNLALTSQE